MLSGDRLTELVDPDYAKPEVVARATIVEDMTMKQVRRPTGERSRLWLAPVFGNVTRATG